MVPVGYCRRFSNGAVEVVCRTRSPRRQRHYHDDGATRAKRAAFPDCFCISPRDGDCRIGSTGAARSQAGRRFFFFTLAAACRKHLQQGGPTPRPMAASVQFQTRGRDARRMNMSTASVAFAAWWRDSVSCMSVRPQPSGRWPRPARSRTPFRATRRQTTRRAAGMFLPGRWTGPLDS